MMSIEKQFSPRNPSEIRDGIDEYHEEFGEKRSRPEHDVKKEGVPTKPNFHEWAKGDPNPKEILRMKREDREAALRALHRVIRMRYQGVGDLRQRVLATVEKDPHVSQEELLSIVTGYAKRYALNREILAKMREIIDGWISWRNDLHERYHATDPEVIISQALRPEQGEIKELLRSELVGQGESLGIHSLENNPIGFQCVLGPHCAKIRISSGEARKKLSKDGLNVGFFSSVTQAAFDLKGRYAWEPPGDSLTMLHEEGHAIFNATQPLNQEREVKGNENEKAFFMFALYDARNEILARLRENKTRGVSGGLEHLEYMMLYGYKKRFIPDIPEEQWNRNTPPFSEELLETHPLERGESFGSP